MPEDRPNPLDDLMPHLEDTVHVIGTFFIEGTNGKSMRCAIVRLICREGPLREWPPNLVYKRAFEVHSQMGLFMIYDPADPVNPYLLAEWLDDYEDFIRLADASGFFVMEIWTPSKKRSVLVRRSVVEMHQERAIMVEEYIAVATEPTRTIKTNVNHQGKA